MTNQEAQQFSNTVISDYYEAMFHLMTEFIPRERIAIAHQRAVKVAKRNASMYAKEIVRQ